MSARPEPVPAGGPGTTVPIGTAVAARRRGARRSRQDVIAAAGALFAERGFHGTSMRDLGDALGLVGSSLYAHIGSKNELLVEVIRSGADLFGGLAGEVAAAGGTPVERLARLVAGHVAILVENPDRAATFLNEARHLPDGDRAAVLAWRDAYQDAFRAAFADGVADGSFRADLDVRLTATFTLSLLNSVERWYDPAGDRDPAALAAALWTFVHRGVRP